MTVRATLLLLLTLFVRQPHAVAQEDLPHGRLLDLSIPSPDAASLGKFGNVPVSFNSGVPNITIPIYSYLDKNMGLGLNISLDYHAGGIRVQEKSSSVGTGWALNAGGVITRQMRGGPDEGGMGYTGYWSGPALPNIADYQANENLYGTTTGAANPYYRYAEGFEDAEPDVFVFNFAGRSGKFIIGKNNEVLLFNHQQLQVTRTWGGTLAFTIITEDGVKYIFDQQENTASYNDQLVYYTGSAWYLSKIVAPFNAGEINFTYTSYISYYAMLQSQTMFKSMGGSNAELNGVHTNANPSSFQAKRLTGITFPKGVTAAFLYNNSVGRCDMSGDDKVLQAIEISDGVNTKGFRLAQNYSFSTTEPLPTSCAGYNEQTARLVLHSVTEYAGAVEKRPYVIEYETGSLPGTMSYALDHWGFYNGALGNASLLPYNGTGQGTPPVGAQDNANRNPDFSYAKNGTIKKLIYPTGGASEFLFEANTIPAASGQTQSVAAHAYINGMLPEKSTNFTVYKSGTLATPTSFHFEFGGFSPANNNCRIIARITSLDGVTTYATVTLGPGVGYSHTIAVTIPPGEFKYQYAFESPSSPCYTELFSVALDWTNFVEIPAGQPVNVGGIRIKKVMEYDGIQPTPIKTREYKYVQANGEYSSGVQAAKPEYVYFYSSTCVGSCTLQEVAICAAKNAEYTVIASSSLFTLANVLGNTVSYSRVEELFTGDGAGNNGKIVRTYTTSATSPTHGFPFDAFNPAMMHTPFVTPQQLDWIYGALLTQETYDNQNVLQHRLVNSYYHGADQLSAGTKENFKGIKTYKRTTRYWDCGASVLSYQFYLNQYYPVVGLTQLTSSVETSYNNLGKTSVKSTAYEYHPNYYSVAKVRTIDSRGKLIEQRMYYPFNYTMPGVLQELVSTHHIYSPVISTEVWQEVTGNPSSRQLAGGIITEYAKFNNTIIKPYKVYDFAAKLPVNESVIGVFNPAQLIRSNTYFKPKVLFQSYLNSGYLTEQRKLTDDVPYSYIWSGGFTYPVAQVINARANEIFYESFEAAAGWEPNLTYDNSVVHSGRTAGRIVNPGGSEMISHPFQWLNVSLSAPTEFTYSAWCYSNAPTVDVYLIMKRANETGYASYTDVITLNTTQQWTLAEKKFTVPADVTQLLIRLDNNGGGTVWFDDVRLHPSAGLMSTNTTLALLGVTSQGDENNDYVHYEYDVLQRLHLVKDRQKNILKMLCYNYWGQPEPCTPSIAALWQSTGTVRCKPCPANPVYVTNIREHQERDINANSPTFNTLRWVEDGVQAACVPTVDWQNTSTPVRCRRDQNNQNTGELEQEQVNANPCGNGETRWIVVGTNTTTCPLPPPCNSSNCTGNDKKCVNGVCETGTLVCVSSVEEARGRYKCTWRYCFSDGTVSTYSVNTISATPCKITVCH